MPKSSRTTGVTVVKAEWPESFQPARSVLGRGCRSREQCRWPEMTRWLYVGLRQQLCATQGEVCLLPRFKCCTLLQCLCRLQSRSISHLHDLDRSIVRKMFLDLFSVGLLYSAWKKNAITGAHCFSYAAIRKQCRSAWGRRPGRSLAINGQKTTWNNFRDCTDLAKAFPCSCDIPIRQGVRNKSFWNKKTKSRGSTQVQSSMDCHDGHIHEVSWRSLFLGLEWLLTSYSSAYWSVQQIMKPNVWINHLLRKLLLFTTLNISVQ